mgnify:CR=1 FL=1
MSELKQKKVSRSPSHGKKNAKGNKRITKTRKNEKYIPDFEVYNDPIKRGSSDPVKGFFQAQLVYEDYHEFLSMYKKYMLRYPAEYFDAFCRVSCGQWYPDLFFSKYFRNLLTKIPLPRVLNPKNLAFLKTYDNYLLLQYNS